MTRPSKNAYMEVIRLLVDLLELPLRDQTLSPDWADARDKLVSDGRSVLKQHDKHVRAGETTNEPI